MTKVKVNRLICIWMVREVRAGFLIERHVKIGTGSSQYASVVWMCDCDLGAFAFYYCFEECLEVSRSMTRYPGRPCLPRYRKIMNCGISGSDSGVEYVAAYKRVFTFLHGMDLLDLL
jgi:hypothetical protein